MRPSLLILGLALSACAETSTAPHTTARPTDEAKEDADSEFLLRMSGDSFSARFDDAGCHNPKVQLSRYPNVIRGATDGQPIELLLEGERIHGTVGPLPVDLKLSVDQAGVHLVGLYAGNQSDLTIGPKALHGQVGRCFYEAVGSGGVYKGQRTCSTNLSGILVRLPKRMRELPIVEFAAFSAALLGQ